MPFTQLEVGCILQFELGLGYWNWNPLFEVSLLFTTMQP